MLEIFKYCLLITYYIVFKSNIEHVVRREDGRLERAVVLTTMSAIISIYDFSMLSLMLMAVYSAITYAEYKFDPDILSASSAALTTCSVLRIFSSSVSVLAYIAFILILLSKLREKSIKIIFTEISKVAVLTLTIL